MSVKNWKKCLEVIRHHIIKCFVPRSFSFAFRDSRTRKLASVLTLPGKSYPSGGNVFSMSDWMG